MKGKKMSNLFKRECIGILVVISFVVLFPNLSFAFDDGDFQYWNTEGASWKISNDSKVNLEQEFRFGDNAGNPYYNHTDIGISYSGLYDWLVLGLNYRHVNEEKSSGWKVENRPHLNATVKFELAELNFSNRGRLEYRNKEDADNYFRYRNKFAVKFPFKLTDFAIQPYVADEWFYDFDSKRLNRNRFYSGIIFKLLDNLSGEVYYLLERNESSSTKKWTDVNVLGTKLKIYF